MEIKKGIGVSPGVVIGTAVVFDAEDTVIPRRSITPDAIGGEVARLQEALDAAGAEVRHLRDKVDGEHGKEISGIFDFHLGVLRDKSLIKSIEKEIGEH